MLYELISVRNGEIVQKKTFAELPQPLSTRLLVNFFLRLSATQSLGTPLRVTFGRFQLTAQTGAALMLLLVSERVEYGLAAGLIQVFSGEEGFCIGLSEAVAAVASLALRSMLQPHDARIHVLRTKIGKSYSETTKQEDQGQFGGVLEHFLDRMAAMQVERVSLRVGPDFLQLLQNDAVSVAYAEPFDPQRAGGPDSVACGCRTLQACAALQKQIAAE